MRNPATQVAPETADGDFDPVDGFPGTLIDEPSALGDYKVPAESRASVERGLPGLCAERTHLRRVRTGYRDTTGGDAIVLNILWGIGVAVTMGVGAVAGGFVYQRAGALAGFAAGALGLAVGRVVGWAAVKLMRLHLERQERFRLATVAALTNDIRRLDKRIARAYSEHGLLGDPG